MNRDLAVYRKINLIFAGIFLCIFIYSGFFAYTGLPHVIPSLHKFYASEPAISTGLSRSFSAMMKLNIFQAREYNYYGPSLFVFFLVQFFLRLFFSSGSAHKLYALEEIILLDIIISVAMFILFFEPFINGYMT